MTRATLRQFRNLLSQIQFCVKDVTSADVHIQENYNNLVITVTIPK